MTRAVRGDFRVLHVLALSTVLVAAGIWGRLPPAPDTWIHLALEAAGIALALLVAALVLIRYQVDRRAADLLVGTGFLGAGLLAMLHAGMTILDWAPGLAVDSVDLGVWGWTAPRLYLALALAFVWLVGHRVTIDGGESDPLARGILAGGFLLAIGLVVFLLAGRLPPAVQPEGVLVRPFELLPAGLFAAGLAGQLVRRAWRRDPFERGLVLFLGLGLALHLFVGFLSAGPLDAPSLVARVGALGAAVVLMAGVLATVRNVYRQANEAVTAVILSNQALAREMEVRREAERVFRETEARLQDFLDHAHDLIQSTSPEGRILYVNEAWRRRLGYEDADIEGLSVHDVVHPDSLGRYEEAMARVFQGEALADFQVVFRAKDGSKVVCSGSSNCRFEEGRPVATRSIFRDISQERQRERELARFQANLRAVFESTGDAIWSVDRSHRLLTFNAAYALILEAVTGRSPEVGDSLEDVVAPEVIGWFKGCYDRALAGDRFSATREERVDGQIRSFELYFNPIESVDEGPTGVVVFSRDVTRRRRVEEALRRAKQEAEEASRTKSQFLANMSHELRTPLNSIIGFASILTKKARPGLHERDLGFLERILANGKHLLVLINEILDLSKIEAGRMEVQLESVELRRLIQETVQQLEAQVAGRPVALRSEIEGDPAPVRTDRGRLKQILINLVGNALKFTEEGEVVVRVETADDGRTPTWLHVRDTGIGIPEERLDTIFQAFQQADGGTTRRFGGTGLGLTISRSLCTLLGYELQVRSEVGEGSTFSIHLDREASGDPEGSDGERLGSLERTGGLPRVGELAAATLDLGGRKILVVDDEEDSRALLSHYLQDLGCRVVTARDGIEGLEVARRESPDLITVDLMMPRMSGWEMLRAAREDPQLREVPMVVVSIVAEEGGGQVLGAVDLLTKPVDREELARTLRRNLVPGLGRALVVEDNRDHRAVLQRYLRDSGITADGVGNGVEALEYLARVPVDLVLLDLLMPTMDGLALLERMRASAGLARIPVVVLTAKTLEPEEEALLSRAGVRVIQKGADVELHLRQALDQYFGLRAPGQ